MLISGCVNHYVLPTSELKNLNGYDIHNERTVSVITGYAGGDSRGGSFPVVSTTPLTDRPYRMIAASGDPVDFSSERSLRLVSDKGAPYAFSRPRDDGCRGSA